MAFWRTRSAVRLPALLVAGVLPALTPSPATAGAGGHAPRLRALVYSDPQMCDDSQATVAKAMAARHGVARFDFAVSMGDNLAQTSDDMMQRCFERPYSQLIADKVVFYAGVGNHDLEDNRIATELAYSRQMDVEARGVGGFAMPAENFVIRRPNLKWVLLNVARADGSIGFEETTRAFAERELCEDTSDWKVVGFHYPPWSTGWRGDNKAWQEVILPLLERCHVDFVFSGHEHHAELFLPWNWTTFAIVGNSSQVRPPFGWSARESLFRLRETGFAELEIEGDVARLAFFNHAGSERHRSSFQKRVPFWCDTWRREGSRVLGRIKLPAGLAVDTVTAEVGFSKTAQDPLAPGAAWRFHAARYAGEGAAPDLAAFAGDIPADSGDGFAVFRYRVGDGPWIYGDLSDAPGLHGNYDGIQTPHLLQVKSKGGAE